jgi:hypothetical protein
MTALGSTCVPGSGECGTGAYCDTTSTKCTLWPSATGATCGVTTAGETIGCLGSYCSTPNGPDGGSSNTGTCVGPVAANQPCDVGNGSAIGNTCVQGYVCSGALTGGCGTCVQTSCY